VCISPNMDEETKNDIKHTLIRDSRTTGV